MQRLPLKSRISTIAPLGLRSRPLLKPGSQLPAIRSRALLTRLNAVRPTESDGLFGKPFDRAEDGSLFGIKLGDIGVHGLLVSVQLAFAIWYIAGAQVLGENTDPLSFALLREVGATVCLWGLARTFEGPVHIEREDYKDVISAGVACFLVVSGFTYALQYVSEFNCAVAQPLVPPACLVLSAASGYERLTKLSVAGIGLSVVGSMAITLVGSGAAGAPSSNELLGDGLLALQVCASAYMAVNLKSLAAKYPYLTTTAAYYTVASAMCAAVVGQQSGWDAGALVRDVAEWNPATWEVLAYAMVVATTFTYGAQTYAASKTAPSTVAVYSTLQPFFVALGMYVVFGRALTGEQLGAASLIVLGLIFSVAGQENIEELHAPLWTYHLGFWQGATMSVVTEAAEVAVEEEDDGHGAVVGALAATGAVAVGLASDVQGKTTNAVAWVAGLGSDSEPEEGPAQESVEVGTATAVEEILRMDTVIEDCMQMGDVGGDDPVDGRSA